MQRTITEKIQESLEPTHLEVIDESHMHNVPPGSESHFKVIVVTAAFEGKPLIARHQTVNGILAEELEARIHALSLSTLTAAEWERKHGRTPPTPACLGGGREKP